MKLGILAAGILLWPVVGLAAPVQNPTAPPTRLLRVYLDCPACEGDYVRQTVTFVDFVRDRAVADVDVLVTTQSTGSGGTSWVVTLLGAGRFRGEDRSLTFLTSAEATSDDRRREFVRVFELGLVGYAAATSVSGDLDVQWKPPATPPPARTDPWHFWAFQVSGQAGLNGEVATQKHSYQVGFSGNRTTAAWKVSLAAAGASNESTYTVNEAQTVRTTTHSRSANLLVVKSLNAHWSAGGRASLSAASFSNTALAFAVAPAVEYDVFPYAQSDRRIFTLQYSLGVSRYDYRALTIFDKLSETIPSHRVAAFLAVREPWGSIDGEVTASQFLNRPSRYATSLSASAEVQLGRGFSFYLSGGYDKVEDQVSLAKGNATPEEILLGLRQLATDYRSAVTFGFSYSFGSVFNTVVNPRLSGMRSTIF